ncbi:UDP-glycosyltransferase 89B1 [Acorus calamus]|uniref:UDP-glycosyltransferase 89B1 n=1 Tax=Acorus calamus TaxID=4465 RepID=A0AAV9EDL6_ACOCL|nr:UDP-glycosyltransferase 89B1 [Acorus calamus]
MGQGPPHPSTFNRLGPLPRLDSATRGRTRRATCRLLTVWSPVPVSHLRTVEGDAQTTDDVSFPTLPNSPIYPWRQLSMLYRMYREGDPVSEFVKKGMRDNIASWGVIINSFKGMDGAYVDHLRRDLGHNRVWEVGPLNVSGVRVERAGLGRDVKGWLDGCPVGSVVYCVLRDHDRVDCAAGVTAGVSLLAWPMLADQFFNARLVVEELGVAVMVCEGEESVPEVGELAEKVKQAVSEGGGEMGVRGRELGRKALEAVEVGGSSYEDLDGFVGEVVKLHCLTIGSWRVTVLTKMAKKESQLATSAARMGRRSVWKEGEDDIKESVP